MTSPLLVEVRDASMRRAAELDDYSKLDLKLRACSVGTWSVTCPASHPAALALTFLGGIVVSRDGVTVQSGPTTRLQVQSTRLDGGRVVEELVASGVDDTDILASRLALPDPSGPPYPQAYDLASGPAETVLRGYVDRNLGPSAVPARRDPRVVLPASAGRGGYVQGVPDRYVNLLTFLQETALAAGIGFRVVQVDTHLEVQWYVPIDRSDTIVLGLDRGNLASYTYATTRPEVNYLYAGGTGDLGARLIAEGQDAASVAAYRRREAFLDQNNQSDPAVLAQKITEQLAGASASSTLKLVPLTAPGSTFLVDYALDDIVAVRLSEGATIVDRVAGVDLTVSGGQETITPTVATDGANLTGLNLIDTLRRYGRRLTRIEGRT